MFRLTLGVMIILVFTVGGNLPKAAAGPQGATDPLFFEDLLPALRTAPAPDWLRPGMRFSYFSAAAAIPVWTYETYVLPDGTNFKIPVLPGGFLDTGGHGRGVSGAGVTQVNVVYLDRTVAVLDIRNYPLDPQTGQLSLASAQAAVGRPGAGSDFWLHPGVLATAAGGRLDTGTGAQLIALRIPAFRVGNRRVTVIRFQERVVNRPQFVSWNFEERTGILVLNSMQGHVVNMFTQNTFLELRAPTIPWANAPAPPFVAATRVLHYQGTWAMYVAGSPVVPLAVSTTFRLRSLGGNWARYRQEVVEPKAPGLPGNVNELDRVFGPAQIGGLWIHPNVLARLQPGQVVDRDPTTGVVTTVIAGGGQIGISEANSGHRVDYLYDRRLGVMVFFRLTDLVLSTVLQFQLASMQ